jgi:hypothetical protein
MDTLDLERGRRMRALQDHLEGAHDVAARITEMVREPGLIFLHVGAHESEGTDYHQEVAR